MNIASINLIRRRPWVRLVVDAALFIAAAVILAACGLAFGDCYKDPVTGLEVCTTTTASPAAICRFAAVDREAPLPLGADGIRDSGTCTLVYDDGRRAIVFTAWHNLRNTTPPYSVRIRDRWQPATIIATDPAAELAALELAGGLGVTPVAIDEGQLPGEVCGGGFGGGDDGFQFKQVCGRITATPWQEGFRGFTGAVREGDSGGPVLTHEGRLVGVLWGNNIEYHEVMFTCDQPLRRFLDRVLPGRPARIIPHYQPPVRLPPTQWQSAPPATRPPVAATGVPTRPPAVNEATPPTYATPRPPRPPEVPPARIENPPPTSPTPPVTQLPPPGATGPPAVPPITVAPPSSPPANPTSPIAPPFEPSVYATPAPLRLPPIDGLATSLVTKLLVFGGLPIGGAAIAAPIVWWLMKRGEKRVAGKIHGQGKPNHSTSEANSTVSGAAGTAEQTFRYSQQTSTHEPIPRDGSEGEQLLQLGQLEGRSPFLDAVAGRVVQPRLQAIAEGSGDAQQKQWARDVLNEIDAEFNRIAPARTTITK